MNIPKTLLIIAAGMGSRYGGLKQIDPIGPNGEIIIDYSMYDAIRAGFTKVVFVIRHHFEEAFRNKIGNKLESLVEKEDKEIAQACIRKLIDDGIYPEKLW